MSTISDYLENELLDHVLGTGTFSSPANLYVALSTANPGDDNTGLAEPAGGAYARVNHNTWDTAASRATENTGQITFPQATGSWGTITHWAIMDASSGGNQIAHGAFTVSKAVVAGNTPRIADGDIDVSWVTSGISNFLANELLDHVFGNGDYTAPSNLYIGLSTANPGDDASGIAEPAGGAYARAIHNDFDVAVAGATRNASGFVWPDATGSWGTISDMFISDAGSSGNMLLYAFTANSSGDAITQAVTSGDTVQMVASGLVLTAD